MYIQNLEKLRKQLNQREEPRVEVNRQGIIPTRMLNQPETAVPASDPLNLSREWINRIKSSSAVFREKVAKQTPPPQEAPGIVKAAAKIIERREEAQTAKEEAEKASMFAKGGIDFDQFDPANGNFSLDISDAASLIRQKEGFRETPYWDVNAYRVGYGTDTITRADGTVERVTKGTRVSKEDAERDLARRIQEFQSGIISKVGSENWGMLPQKAQAALTSVAYNYGSLPGKVATAVKTNDLSAIASAVESLASHNKGINASRRRHEAALIRSALNA